MAAKKTIREELMKFEREIAPLKERKKELEKQIFAILEQAKQPA